LKGAARRTPFTEVVACSDGITVKNPPPEIIKTRETKQRE
jgi:hypothetical protein